MYQYPSNQQYPPRYPTIYTKTSTWAIISLIASILGWLGLFGFGGIAGIICGYVAKSEINNSRGTVTGSGLATAGLILGWANIILVILAVIVAVVMPLLGVALCGGAGIVDSILNQ